MKNVLLLDTNFSSAPLYNYLINNYVVFVLGNNPEDYLAKISPNYYNINYAEINLVQDFIKDKKIDFLIPGCNDFSYKICSELNEFNNFIGIESTIINNIINNKDEFRKFSLDNNVSVPRVFSTKDIPQNTKIIVKPIDSFSGNGITVLENVNKKNMDDAIKLAKIASKSNGFLIEEFVDGQLYSHSAFIRNNEIYKDFIVEEHCIANSFAVDTSWLNNDFCPVTLQEIRNQINFIVKKLNLQDGLLHTQLIKNNNKFWIIEVTRRCPGDLYSLLIEKSTGFPYAEEYCNYFLTSKVYKNQNIKFQKDIIRHTITTINEQYFSSLEFNYPIHINQYLQISSIGNKLLSAPKGRIGLLFIKIKEDESEKIRSLILKRNLYNITQTI
jgi:predicted ATP-grasp superfamily ATP-dependent carboligase